MSAGFLSETRHSDEDTLTLSAPVAMDRIRHCRTTLFDSGSEPSAHCGRIPKDFCTQSRNTPLVRHSADALAQRGLITRENEPVVGNKPMAFVAILLLNFVWKLHKQRHLQQPSLASIICVDL